MGENYSTCKNVFWCEEHEHAVFEPVDESAINSRHCAKPTAQRNMSTTTQEELQVSSKRGTTEADRAIEITEKEVAGAKEKVSEAKQEVAGAKEKILKAKQEVVEAEQKVAKAEQKVAKAKQEVFNYNGRDEDIHKSLKQKWTITQEGVEIAQKGLKLAQEGVGIAYIQLIVAVAGLAALNGQLSVEWNTNTFHRSVGESPISKNMLSSICSAKVEAWDFQAPVGKKQSVRPKNLRKRAAQHYHVWKNNGDCKCQLSGKWGKSNSVATSHLLKHSTNIHVRGQYEISDINDMRKPSHTRHVLTKLSKEGAFILKELMIL